MYRGMSVEDFLETCPRGIVQRGRGLIHIQIDSFSPVILLAQQAQLKILVVCFV